MAESESVQSVVSQVAIQAATAVMVVLRIGINMGPKGEGSEMQRELPDNIRGQGIWLNQTK